VVIGKHEFAKSLIGVVDALKALANLIKTTKLQILRKFLLENCDFYGILNIF
jgi:hypothetical protein